LAIAVSRQRSRQATKPRFLREVGSFALRTGVLFGLAGIVIQLLAQPRGTGTWDERGAYERTMLLSTLVLLRVTALWRALADGEPPGAQRDRYWLLGLAAIPLYLPAMYLPPAARFFELRPLAWQDWALVLLVVGPTYLVTLLSDKWLGPKDTNA